MGVDSMPKMEIQIGVLYTQFHEISLKQNTQKTSTKNTNRM